MDLRHFAGVGLQVFELLFSCFFPRISDFRGRLVVFRVRYLGGALGLWCSPGFFFSLFSVAPRMFFFLQRGFLSTGSLS